MQRKFLILLGALGLLFLQNACSWRGGDRTLYPLKPAGNAVKYQPLAGVWTGTLDKEKINVIATLNYDNKREDFCLDIIYNVNDAKPQEQISVPSMRGHFTELNGETYFAASLDSEALEAQLKKLGNGGYPLGLLIIPAYYTLKLEIHENTITVYALYFSRWDKDDKFRGKINENMNYDQEYRLLLNPQAQIQEFIGKKEFIAQRLTTLQRKTITSTMPQP